MKLTALFAKCKTWRCAAEIRILGIEGFYFWGGELKYEGSSFHLVCKECTRSHRYTVRDVIVRYGADAL